MPISTYPIDEATTDIRDLQQMPTTGPIEADDSAFAEPLCTQHCCWLAGPTSLAALAPN